MPQLEILNAIDDAISDGQDPFDNFRNHFGISGIGRNCAREKWYSYRWATLRKIPPRIQRIFNTGHREEPRIIGLLEAAGFKVLSVDPDTGDQFRVKDQKLPVIAGSLDAVIIDLLDGKFCGLEVKTMKASVFNQLVKSNVEENKPDHYSQMQGYLRESKSTKYPLAAFLYIAKNKDNEELYSEMILPDVDKQESDSAEAHFVVKAKTPPDRISRFADWFECRFCDHKAICHQDALPHRNCRTCAHGEPDFSDAEFWECKRFETTVTREIALEGCSFYRAKDM